MKLTHNILWNSAGICLPLLVGVVVVPPIVKGLGTERFGFLSIIWMMIGYFSIFDFGLGRSLTKLAADRLAASRDDEIAPLASTTLIMVVASSAAMSLVIASAADFIARRTFGASPSMIPETTHAILWLSASLPFVLLATALTGLLEAYQEFALINLIRLPLGILVLTAPFAILPFSKNLGVITAVLAGIRVLNACVLTVVTIRIVPALGRAPFVFSRALLRPLLVFGGWLTVSNVVGPLMVYFDRFVIAAMLGGTAIAFYTVPYDVLNRLLLFPQAIQGVLFPSFTIMRAQNSTRIVSVFVRSSNATLSLMVPPLAAVMLFAHQALAWWLGTAFADGGSQTAKILMIGVAVNAMARTPFVFVQGAGHAKWTAMLHFVELPLYALALWSLLGGGLGIVGAAYAWTGRIIVDAVVLYAMTSRLDHRLIGTVLRDLLAVGSVCIFAVLLDWWLPSTLMRVLAVLILSVASGLILLRYVYGIHPILSKAEA